MRRKEGSSRKKFRRRIGLLRILRVEEDLAKEGCSIKIRGYHWARSTTALQTGCLHQTDATPSSISGLEHKRQAHHIGYASKISSRLEL